MQRALEATIRKFLHYSLADVGFNYDQLTDTERSLATREEFEAMAEYAKKPPTEGYVLAREVCVGDSVEHFGVFHGPITHIDTPPWCLENRLILHTVHASFELDVTDSVLVRFGAPGIKAA